MKKRRVLRYILLSYAIVTLVPFLALGLFTFGSMNDFYENEMLENRVSMLQLVRNDFDVLVSEMYTNAIQMMSGNDFTTAHLQSAYGNMYDVKRQLQALSIASDYLYDILYTNGELEQVHSTETMFTYARFSRYSRSAMLAQENIPEAFLPDAYTAWVPAARESGETNAAFGYVVTDKRGRKLPKRSIVYVLKSETMDRLFGSYIDKLQAYIVLFDNGTCIYSSPGTPSGIFEEPSWAEALDYDKLVNLEIAKEKWVAYKADSQKSGPTYMILIPHETIIAEIRQPFNRALLVYAVSILVIGAGILFFTRKSYQPVRTVSELARGNLDFEQGDMNEMELARYALQVMRNERAVRRKEERLIRLLNTGDGSVDGDMLMVLRLSSRKGIILMADDYREYASFLQANAPGEGICGVTALPLKACLCVFMKQCEPAAAQLLLQQVQHLMEGAFDIVCWGGYQSLKDGADEAFRAALRSGTEQERLASEVSRGTIIEPGTDERSFSEIMRYIQSQYSSCDFSAKAIAAKFDMSLSNFSHYFKKNTGRTFSDYMSALRLEKAKLLLRTTDLPLCDIAEKCGHLNASAFMRTFKKQTGTTASTYRNSYRESWEVQRADQHFEQGR